MVRYLQTPYDYCEQLAATMQMGYEDKHLLTGDELLLEPNQKVVAQVLDALTAENMLIIAVSKAYEEGP